MQTFSGAKNGYVFKKGSAGVGYYRDGVPEDVDSGEPASKRARIEAAGRAMAREMDGAALLEEAEAAAEEKSGGAAVALDLDLHGLKVTSGNGPHVHHSHRCHHNHLCHDHRHCCWASRRKLTRTRYVMCMPPC